jgi:hypothetical protein
MAAIMKGETVMAIHRVSRYQAGWKKGEDVFSEGCGWIRLFFQGGGEEAFSVSKADYDGMVDVLRNEEPLCWDEVGKFLYTTDEPVGEEES